jgi:two-component system NarL family sensor kinase
LDHLGLKRALEAMLDHASQASRVQFTYKFEPVDELFSADASLNLYRVVQESLNNILKHAHASHVNIQLERDIHEVQLRIEDDGVGFDLQKVGDKKGLGLRNITERVRMLGGKLNMTSLPGHGTRTEVAIPIAEKPA